VATAGAAADATDGTASATPQLTSAVTKFRLV
jgi:hypothetical protein